MCAVEASCPFRMMARVDALDGERAALRPRASLLLEHLELERELSLSMCEPHLMVTCCQLPVSYRIAY